MAGYRSYGHHIDGGDPIELCALPTVPLFMEGEVLDNPEQVKAELKDDLAAYNAKMLENMSDFFQAQVESKSLDARKMISPDGDSWEACKLAEGTVGAVYKGKDEDGTPVIVKVQQTSEPAAQPCEQPAWRAVRELYVHAVCSCPAHPNVCQLKGWGIKSKGPTLEGLTDGDQVYMVQEFAGEELQKIIDEGRTVAPNLAYNYLQQLATGLTHLHQRKFYHRNLKLENVAVSEGQVVKLIDFGSSTSVAAGYAGSAEADEEEGGDGGAVATERTQVISLSQKAHTRAPEVVLGQSVKGIWEEQEKVRI